MRTRNVRTVPTQFDEVRRRFERWRRKRERRSRIPEDLWALAIELAREQGLYPTARTLRLNYYSLKKRLESAGGSQVASTAPTFVELVSPGLACSSECVIELENGRGGKMRIYLKGVEKPDLGALSSSFWGAER